jgi:hypothetical protein
LEQSFSPSSNIALIQEISPNWRLFFQKSLTAPQSNYIWLSVCYFTLLAVVKKRGCKEKIRKADKKQDPQADKERR